MPYDLSRTLVVGVSATALFDLSEADAVFQAKVQDAPDEAIDAYRKYMLVLENEPLAPGTSYSLVKALLDLNKYKMSEDDPPLVEVVVMSRNSPETGVRVLKVIRRDGLPISRSVFTGGEPVVDYLEAFDVDLFLTTSAEDAQNVSDSAVCPAALVYPPPSSAVPLPENQVRIAFDGDAVLFSEASEVVNKTEGLAAFHRTENEASAVPLDDGPYASLLRKLGKLQERLPMRVEYSPVRIAVVTARNAPAELRVIMTLRSWRVYVDAVFFLGGVSKEKVLRAFKPHIFFDDQPVHLSEASKVVSAAQVPYRTGSPLAVVPPPVVTEASGRVEARGEAAQQAVAADGAAPASVSRGGIAGPAAERPVVDRHPDDRRVVLNGLLAPERSRNRQPTLRRQDASLAKASPRRSSA